MQRLSLRSFDLKVRLGGVGLLLVAACLLAVLSARSPDRARQPTVLELCMAFAAVCSGSTGASFVFVGRQMFEPVLSPRERAMPEGER